MLKVAITGNIASGKSQVEKLISSKYQVFDADKIAHKILNNITYFYGYDVFTNNRIDRKKLGKLVFSNMELRKKLENIVHPQVKDEIIKIFNNSAEKIVFISIPLLFETGFNTLFDKIIFIDAEEETRINRIMQRNNLSRADAILRVKSQDKPEDKIKQCDYIINNNGSMKDLETQILVLIRELSSLI